MKALIARLLGADRRKVIAVFAANREEAARAVAHAQTSGAGLPVCVWCAEDIASAGAIPGCDELRSGTSIRDFKDVWPALSIVSWTGKPSSITLKLAALLRPPFRVVVFNEAGGFFAPAPAAVAKHASRRIRDRAVGGIRRTSELLIGAAQWAGARIWDAAQWAFWHFFHGALWTLRLIPRGFWLLWPALWWCVERVRDAGRVIWSLAWRAGERLRDWMFILLGICAVPLAPLSRAAVKRTRRTRGHPVTAITGRGARTKEVTIPSRGWSRGAVLEAAESDADFVVLRKRGESACAQPLVEIALETGAFAVARQMAFSCWRKTVVTKHPFRKLQPGEVAEVLAPYSSLIVIRRSTLLELGVPKALTGGCALMLLFWKAAAAGLRTLVAGHGDPITDEPAMDLEDAEFAARLTVSTGLAALGAARPARFRGNLAWSPYHLRADRGNPRVLVVSPYLPFPLSHGGAVRIYNLCRSLKDRVDFTLACFHEANEKVCYDELHEVFREVYVVDVDEKRPDPSVPKQVAEYRNAAMADLIHHLCSNNQVDVVQLEYTQMAEYRKYAGAVPVILVEHDITFTLYSQLADFRKDEAARQEYERWRDFERDALQCSNGVWTMSEDECGVALDHRAPRHSTVVIPNGVDIDRFVPMPKREGPPTVLFVGSFRHLPNLLAYEELRSKIMPAVWRECPETVLHVIAGPQHEKAAESAGKTTLLAAHPKIVLEGFVSDVRPAYTSADVVAVPLPLSAGTNIKLLEAMACGRAIVSTQSGCRGLNLTSGDELIVTELDESFGQAIVTLLRDEGLRNRLAAEARRTAEARFGWNAIAEDAFGSYMQVTGSGAAAPAGVLPQHR